MKKYILLLVMILGAYNGNAQVLKTTQEAQFDTTYGYFNTEKKIPLITTLVNIVIPENAGWVDRINTFEDIGNPDPYKIQRLEYDYNKKFSKKDFTKINDTLFILAGFKL